MLFIFSVNVGALHIPRGGTRTRLLKLRGPDNSIHKKSSMVNIVNDDHLCMVRALGVCLAKHCVVPDEAWKILKKELRHMTNPQILVQTRQVSASGYINIRNKNRWEQKEVAFLLCQKAGIPTNHPCTLNDISVFEDALQVRIAVIAASLGNKFIRVPNNDHDDWPLLYMYLVNHEGLSHFHAIVNIAGFFSAIYFCDRCFKQYDHNTEHRCEITCLTCKNSNCPETDSTLSCRSCHMFCRSVECFERHKAKRPQKKHNSFYFFYDRFLETLNTISVQYADGRTDTDVLATRNHKGWFKCTGLNSWEPLEKNVSVVSKTSLSSPNRCPVQVTSRKTRIAGPPFNG